MFPSKYAAEKAAMAGEGQQDFDTQQCLDLQNQILSSSPRSPTREVAVASNNNQDTVLESIASLLSNALNAPRSPLPVARFLSPTHIEQCTAGVDDGSASGNLLTKSGRDGEARRRRFDAKGKEQRASDINKKVGAAMNDLTQLSSLSPTQENSQSVYDQFGLQRSIPEVYISSSIEERVADADRDGRHTQANHESLTPKQQHFSAKTDSTAHTYGENDTGHVHFDFLTGTVENHNMDDVSQDASFAPRLDALPRMDSYEPQTPAPPKNPFSQKGSVMKGDEMFGATQPSSIGRCLPSVTSSRPSPDVYNNSSPQKRPISSPLVRRGEETSSLRSSARPLPRSKSIDSPSRVGAPQPSSSRSFDSRRHNLRQPRDIYVSEKESQERRRKEARAASASSLEIDSSDSDSDIDAIARRNQWKRKQEADEAEIRRRLAKVTSSRRDSSSSGMVEVPSTGRRRRSQHEEYVSQSGSLDARGTQQDVIVDSQTLLEGPEDLTLPATAHPSRSLGTNPCSAYESDDVASPILLPRRTPILELERVPDLYPISSTEEAPGAPNNPGSPLQPPSLPLPEVFTNHNDPKTPMTSKNRILSDGADATIPNTILETSPLGEDRILPMGEVTSFSFMQQSQDPIIDEAPGFTQDEEFEDAIRPRTSPTPPPWRSRGFGDKGFPLFAEPPMRAQTLRTSTPDQPSVLDPPMPEYRDVLATTATAKQNEQAPSVVNSGGNRYEVLEKQAEDETRTDGDDELRKNEDQTPVHIDEPEEQVEAETGRNNEVGDADSQVEMEEAPKSAHQLTQTPIKGREGLRSKEELKGPSRQLRRSGEAIALKSSVAPPPAAQSSKPLADFSSTLSTPRSSWAAKSSSATMSSTRKSTRAITRKNEETPISAPRSSVRKSSTQARVRKEEAPVPDLSQKRSSRRLVTKAQVSEEQTPASAPAKRTSKRQSGVSVVDDEQLAPTRSSKRQTTSNATRESSDDPLTWPVSTMGVVPWTKKPAGLFCNMAFAVSYVKQQEERARVSHLIAEQGGRVLEEGFDSLFEPVSFSKSRAQASEDANLVLSVGAKSIGFIALIADEHSRKAKYMQALAMGLPCISGRWILGCVAKGEVIEWTPYLLCAGQSSFLGNAIRSRTLQPYSAADANFPETFSSRERLLDGKSILLVTGKGRAEETRKAYAFLTRVLGPARVGQVVDNEQARKKLQEDDSWDLLYVDKNESATQMAVFGSTSNFGAKKRKRGPAEIDESVPPPKKIRVISDETVIQSLILGQLLEE